MRQSNSQPRASKQDSFSLGYIVPPGIADATVGEGNNWINISWGPLSLSNPAVTGGLYGNYGGGLPLGNHSLTTGSCAVAHIPCPGNARPCMPPGEVVPTPLTDFFGNPRPDGNGAFDVGAVELPGR